MESKSYQSQKSKQIMVQKLVFGGDCLNQDFCD